MRLKKRVSGTSFDGNLTDFPRNWLFPLEGFDVVAAATIDELMRATSEGHDRWVLFPTDGFRL